MQNSFRSLKPFALLTFVVSTLTISCLTDLDGPVYVPGYFALAPSFESSAAGIVDVDAIRVILVRDEDGTVAIDTVVTHEFFSDEVDLSFSVPVSSSAETFTLTIECLSPTGAIVFEAGPLTVTATTSDTENVVAETVPITYVGVGFDAEDIDVPGDDVYYVHMDDTLTLEAIALDSSGAVIEGTPIKWSSSDTNLVKFPIPAIGTMEAGLTRGWVDVTAELLSGQTDIVEVYVEPVPSEITTSHGPGQTGLVGVALPIDIEVIVNAPDGPIEGSIVDFTTGDGGSFSPTFMATTTDGYAWTTWTLGQTAGQQTAVATVRNYPNLQATFTATAATPVAPALRFTVHPSNADVGATITPSVAVTAYDEFGVVDTDFSGDVAIGIGTNPSNGTLSGTRTVTASAGVATFTGLSIDAEGTGYTLEATATGYLAATSNPFNITTAGQGGQVAWTNTNGGNWSDGSNWSTGSPPTASDTATIVVSGEYAVTLDTDAEVSVLLLGDGTNQQAMSVAGATLTVNDSLHINQVAEMTLAGTLTGNGWICVDGNLNWTAGTISGGSADLVVEPAGRVTISGVGTKTLDDRYVSNNGVMEWLEGDLVISSTSMISVELGAHLLISANGRASGTGYIGNSGYIEKSGADSSIVEAPIDNDGDIHVAAGYLVLGGAFYHNTGALLTGSGTIDITGATITTISGDIAPGVSPGILTVQGDLPLDARATVFVEVNGTTAGTDFDHLNVVGNLGRAGTLDITMGFTPSVGNSFGILDFLTTSGSFANIIGLDIGGGMELDPVWGANSLTLNVVTASPTGVNWTNAAGGNWSEPTNWSTGSVPGPSDSVGIHLDGTYTVTLDAPTTVYTLEVGRSAAGTQTLSVASQTLTVDSSVTIGGTGILDMVSGTLDGLGEVTVSAGATAAIESTTVNTQFNNNGTLVVYDQANNINGTYVSGANSTLRVEGVWDTPSTLTVANGFTNNGTIELTNNAVSRTAQLNVTNGTLVNPVGRTLDCLLGASSTSCRLNGEVNNQGTMNVNTTFYWDGTGANHTNAGTITSTGGASITLTLSSATFTNSGTIDASNGGGILVNHSGTSPSFTNSGTINMREFRELRVTNGTFGFPSGAINGPGMLRLNNVTANFDVAFDNATLELASNGTTINGTTGSITNEVGQVMALTSSTVTIPFTNNGTLDIPANTTVFMSDFTHADGAALEGIGTIDLSAATVLAFDGDVNPGGTDATSTLSFIGDALPSSLSTANIEIGGITAGTDYDQVAVSGTFTPDGAVNVSILPGFTPAPGNTFTVLTATSPVSGDFASYTGMDLGGGLVLEPQWNSTSLDLVVTETVPGQILFAGDSGYGGHSGIFTVNADGAGLTNPLPLTSLGNEALYPRWSPDRTRIAFTNPIVGGPTENVLHIMDAAGDTVVPVVTDTSTFVPRWSPNGNHIAFECGDGATEIDVCVVTGVSAQLDLLGGIGDGARKAYVTDLVDVQDFDPANWNNGPWTFAWDPLDDDRIAVVRDSVPAAGGTTVSMIFTMNYDGTLVAPLTAGRAMYIGVGNPLRILGGPDDFSEGGNLDWSPDGMWLIFSAMDNTGQRDIYRISRYGNQLTRLTNTVDADDSPRWSPTGNEIMFGRDLGCNYDLWIMDADGGNPHQVTNEGVCEYQLWRLGADWSPDGQQIVLTGFEGSYNNLFIYVISRLTTAASYLTDRIGPLRGLGAVSFDEVVDIQPSWRP
jgi:Tol biopolymer transport system component